ncbi:MAG: alginate export family protein [Candidatus Wallbacteria bacterium]|nr:alginate export family protein [Candidatus Wallbacteria bacterium]
MKKTSLLPILVGLAFASSATAGDPPAAAEKANSWKLSGSLRTRVEAWDYFKTGNIPVGAENSYTFVGNILKLSAQKSTKDHDYFFELAAPSLLGLPDDAVAPGAKGQLGQGASYRAANGGQQASVFFKQAYLTMKGKEGRKMKVGRFEFVDGLESLPGDAVLDWLKKERIGHRLIGTFGFSHVGRSFDGAQFIQDNPGTLFTAVAAEPTRGVFDLDGEDRLDKIGFQYAGLTFRDADKLQDGRLFALRYDDARGLVKTDNRTLAARKLDLLPVEIYSLGGHYIRKVGDADLLFWGVYQTGDWGAQDHEAWAYDVEAGYRLGGHRDPWLRAGVCNTSGDANPADGRHETFFQAMPTPRIYARNPFYNMMNVNDAFASLTFKASKKASVRTEYHHLQLAEAGDFWYSGGGAFQPQTFGFAGRPSGGSTDLADVVDLALDLKCDADLSVTLYASRAFGGQVVSAIYPAGDTEGYYFLEATRKF